MDEKDMLEKVESAIIMFFKCDSELMDVNANERSISHKLGEHLQAEFPKMNVDCEYNRRGERVKKMNKIVEDSEPVLIDDTDGQTIFPDIIMHRRRNDNENLLVTEIKKSTSRVSRNRDIEKLKVFTGDDFGYQVGLLIDIDVRAKRVNGVLCFQHGELQTRSEWYRIIGLCATEGNQDGGAKLQ